MRHHPGDDRNKDGTARGRRVPEGEITRAVYPTHCPVVMGAAIRLMRRLILYAEWGSKPFGEDVQTEKFYHRSLVHENTYTVTTKDGSEGK